MRQDLSSPIQIGAPLLTGSVTHFSSFAGSSFNWSTTIVRKFNTMTGVGLITRFQGPYCSGELLGDGFLLADGVIVNRGFLTSSGQPILNGGVIWSNNNFLADGLTISNDTLMTDAVDISSNLLGLNAPDPRGFVAERRPECDSTGTYDGILLPGSIVLSTGETLLPVRSLMLDS